MWKKCYAGEKIKIKYRNKSRAITFVDNNGKVRYRNGNQLLLEDPTN
jgi:hypothetical protein